MKSKVCKIVTFLPVVIWMIVIFWFSSKDATASSVQSDVIVAFLRDLFQDNQRVWTRLVSEGIINITNMVRKLAHFTEYAILGFLLLWSFRHYRKGFPHYLAVSTVIGVLYAISDELHQIFVPGRACRFTDVCIDSAGVLFGFAVFALVVWLHRQLLFKVAAKRYPNDTTE